MAALVAVLVLAGCTSDAEPQATPTSTPSSTTSAEGYHMTVTKPARGRWRTEVWRGVQLEVPKRWVLGYAPMPWRHGALSCGVGPLESGDYGRRPYVGRPGYGSDVCLRENLENLGLDRAGLWFGSPLPVGEVLAKTGLRQTTIEVGTSRVTVASKNDRTLDRIIDSVDRVSRDGNGCPERPHVERAYPDEGYGETLSFSVCVYERDRPSDPWMRLWTTALAAARADRLLTAVEEGTAGRPCDLGEGGRLVVLHLTADDPMGDRPLPRDLLLQPSGCASVQQWAAGTPRWVRLSPEMVRPWSVAGVRTYVYSSGLPRTLDRFFRPIWG